MRAVIFPLCVSGSLVCDMSVSVGTFSLSLPIFFFFLPIMLSTSSLSSHIALFRLPSLLCGCLTLPSLLFSFPPSHINTSHFLRIFTLTKGDKKCFYILKKRNSVPLILHGIKLLLWSRQPYSVGVFITASGQSLVIVTQLH